MPRFEMQNTLPPSSSSVWQNFAPRPANCDNAESWKAHGIPLANLKIIIIPNWNQPENESRIQYQTKSIVWFRASIHWRSKVFGSTNENPCGPQENVAWRVDPFCCCKLPPTLPHTRLVRKVRSHDQSQPPARKLCLLQLHYDDGEAVSSYNRICWVHIGSEGHWNIWVSDNHKMVRLRQWQYLARPWSYRKYWHAGWCK